LLADRVYIEGDVAANTANIIDVALLSGPGIADMLAGETIEIVHVSGTSAAANFNIGVVTPPFDELYTVEGTLIKDINYSGSNDRFSLGFDITGLSTAGVLASSVAPGVQNLWNQGTGTLFQREGTHREFNQNPDGSGKAEYKAAAGVWVRGFTSSGSLSPDASRDNFGAGGSHNFDMDGSGIEFGVGYAFNSQWAAGLLGGTSESTVDPDAGGRADIDADTLGAYVTYTPGNGFYADFSYRAMDFDGYGQGGQTEFGFEGSADGYSLEMGYGYKTSSGLIVEPQFQYSSVDVDLDTIGYNMSDFNLTDGDSSLLRIGAALRKSYKTAGGNYWTPYGALSWLNETDGSNSYEIGGLLTGDVDTGGGSALFEAGVTGFIGSFGISAGMNWRDGSAYDSVLGGQLSVRYDW
jgi:outer membrane autotransporter protein